MKHNRAHFDECREIVIESANLDDCVQFLRQIREENNREARAKPRRIYPVWAEPCGGSVVLHYRDWRGQTAIL